MMAIYRTARATRIILAALWLVLTASGLWAWGPETHNAVTRAAITALPADLHDFYKRNERLIISLDNLPDMWRDTHRNQEGYHHFIDLDLLGTPPFDDIPRRYSAAERKYGRAKLLKVGVLPWAIQGRYLKLVTAMRRGDSEGIVVQSAILAHYVADGQNPLHTTSEYNGRTRKQKGIHQRIEEGVADRFIFNWRVEPPRRARKIPDIPDEIFHRLASSFAQVDAIYEADEAAAIADPSRRAEFMRVFTERITPLATSQLQAASTQLADLYYTAWITAGKPKLPPKAAPLFWGR